MNVGEKTIDRDDSFSPARAVYRTLVHFFSYHFILTRKQSTTTHVEGLDLAVLPSVFHPKIFLTSAFFARFLQSLDLQGKNVVEIGTGSGILSLSAAKAGAKSVIALDINPAAVKAANLNAAKNGFEEVRAFQSDLFSAIPAERKFDIIISSPPSFSGEPRDDADRAWHAGPGYRDILPLFKQSAQRLHPNGRMYLLLSSDSNLALMDRLIRSAGLSSKQIAKRSIWVEAFYLYELSLAETDLIPRLGTSDLTASASFQDRQPVQISNSLAAPDHFRCPLRVNRVGLAVSEPLPLYPS